MKHTKTFINVVLVLLCLVFNTSFAQETTTEASNIQIVDAKLGKDVKERMIVDEDSSFALNSKIFLWMKILGAASETITVTWTQGVHSQATTLNIGGTPWRTWASKTLYWPGDWTVTVTDGTGNVLKKISFKVQ